MFCKQTFRLVMVFQKFFMRVFIAVVGDAENTAGRDVELLCDAQDAEELHVLYPDTKRKELLDQFLIGGDVVGGVDDDILFILRLGADDIVERCVGLFLQESQLDVGRRFGLDDVKDIVFAVGACRPDEEEELRFVEETEAGQVHRRLDHADAHRRGKLEGLVVPCADDHRTAPVVLSGAMLIRARLVCAWGLCRRELRVNVTKADFVRRSVKSIITLPGCGGHEDSA